MPASLHPPVLLVADRLGGQCRYSGIHQLARFLRSADTVRTIETPDTRIRRVLGKIWSLLRHGPIRNQSQSFTELQVDAALLAKPAAVVHFLVGENHGSFLTRARSRHRFVATVHMPASYHVPPLPREGRVDTLVLLTSHQREFFQDAWGAKRAVVIRHGVDTDFFLPDSGRPRSRPVILVVGRFLRDFPLTVSTVRLLASRHADWQFAFVVTKETWSSSELAPVRSLPGAKWYDRVDDETLRELYQQSTCLLALFTNCTANNAMVEALACGLPVVTTRRGGVSDYGAGTVYPFPTDATPAALAKLCERYASEPGFRQRTALDCREFAVQELSWPVIAQKHLALYAETARQS